MWGPQILTKTKTCGSRNIESGWGDNLRNWIFIGVERLYSNAFGPLLTSCLEVMHWGLLKMGIKTNCMNKMCKNVDADWYVIKKTHLTANQSQTTERKTANVTRCYPGIGRHCWYNCCHRRHYKTVFSGWIELLMPSKQTWYACSVSISLCSVLCEIFIPCLQQNMNMCFLTALHICTYIL